ncbi:MAG: disulfide bond formation protein B [Gammaproteobacteria bacterium]|jgi:disulfide bond formation protein DsbB|nr:disulfide bond formation protein B [Gammaproteobacteria bacterium]
MTRITVAGARPLYLGGFIVCALLIVTALYMQHGMGLEPCPLCIMQRVAVIVLGLILLVAAIHNPGRIGQRLYAALVMLAAIAGGGVAARHVWLENLPEDRIPACGPGLDYMLENFPLQRVIEMVFRGSGECAEVAWSFLGLSIAGWMLVIFAGFIGFGILLMMRERVKR